MLNPIEKFERSILHLNKTSPSLILKISHTNFRSIIRKGRKLSAVFGVLRAVPIHLRTWYKLLVNSSCKPRNNKPCYIRKALFYKQLACRNNPMVLYKYHLSLHPDIFQAVAYHKSFFSSHHSIIPSNTKMVGIFMICEIKKNTYKFIITYTSNFMGLSKYHSS